MLTTSYLLATITFANDIVPYVTNSSHMRVAHLMRPSFAIYCSMPDIAGCKDDR